MHGVIGNLTRRFMNVKRKTFTFVYVSHSYFFSDPVARISAKLDWKQCMCTNGPLACLFISTRCPMGLNRIGQIQLRVRCPIVITLFDRPLGHDQDF